MLPREAEVVAALIAEWPDDAFPVGYLASGFVDDGRGDVGHDPVLDVLRRRGGRLVVHEYEPEAGVDIAGDLLDPGTWERLCNAGCRSYVATNLLEHLTDRAAFVDLVQRALPPGGRLLVTVPLRYPYHPDPIDTMYRPDPRELAAAFGGLIADRAMAVSDAPAVLRLLRDPAAIVMKLTRVMRDRRASDGRAPVASTSDDHRPGPVGELASALLPARVSVVGFVKPAA